MRLLFRNLVLAIILLGGGSTLASTVPLDQMQALVRAQRQAEAAYLALLNSPPQPTPGLLQLRQEAAAVAAAIATNYALREGYSRGTITVVGPDPEATRARIMGQISNTIAAQEAELQRITSGLRGLERAQLIAPLERATAAWVRATAKRDAALATIERSQGPMTVAAIRLEQDGREAPFAAAWQWADQPGSRASVVAGLEATLASVRSEIALLRSRDLELAREFHWATSIWNGYLQMAISRGEWRAYIDAATQILADLFEVVVAVTTAGTWTTAKILYTIGDTALRMQSSWSIGSNAVATMTALGQEQLSAELKARIVQRIAADLSGGRAIEAQRSLTNWIELPGTLTVIDPWADIAQEGAQSVVSGLIAFFDSAEGRRMLTEPIESLAPWSLALTPSINGGAVDAAAAVAVIQHRRAVDIAADEMKGFLASLGIMVARGAVSFLQELYFTLSSGPTSAELARFLTISELRMFILAESYRQSRALYDALVRIEPALQEALRIERHRLAAAGSRVFQERGGAAVDRAVPVEREIALPFSFVAEVDGARVPWRLEIVRRDGDAEEVIATATGEPSPSRSVATAIIAPDRLPPGLHHLVVRIVSSNPGDQDVDGNPATAASLDPRSLAWVGWEAGPDVYSFALTVLDPNARAEPEAARVIGWFFNALQLRDRTGERFAFVCEPRPEGIWGTVWGTDIYGDDSSICGAAMHAGVITAAGGPVMIEILPGQDRYQGSVRNGVSSMSYGAWPGSYRVVDGG